MAEQGSPVPPSGWDGLVGEVYAAAIDAAAAAALPAALAAACGGSAAFWAAALRADEAVAAETAGLAGAEAALADLAPHLRRAARLRGAVAASVGAARAAAVRRVLGAVATPVLVTDRVGAVRHLNAAAAALSPARAELALATLFPRDAGRLLGAVAAAAERGTSEVLWVRAAAGTGMAAVVRPLPRDPAGGHPEGEALLILRPPAADTDGDATLWAGMFGFTAAEAAVAQALASGDTPAEMAEARGVQVSTVRTLLRRAQHKAGAASLRELAMLLARMPRG